MRVNFYRRQCECECLSDASWKQTNNYDFWSLSFFFDVYLNENLVSEYVEYFNIPQFSD